MSVNSVKGPMTGCGDHDNLRVTY